MRFTYLKEFLLTVTFLLAASPLAAQSAAKARASADKPCTDLDFWAGEWEVKDITGAKIANASIKPTSKHCFFHEVWTEEKTKVDDVCLMAYSNDKHGWQYLCALADAAMSPLRFSEGVLHGDEIRFVQDDLIDGTVHRFSFFNLPDGRVRELSQGSSDGGKTWKTDYD